MPRLIRLHSPGIEEVLLSAGVAREVSRIANTIAETVRGDGAVQRHEAPVVVDYYTATGGRLRGRRFAAAVTIAHPGGAGIEAKYRPLRRALRSSGGGA